MGAWMADPFIAEIRMLSFGYAPRGWATCDGQTLPIAQNQALFSLLGTNYGGDGRVTFKLPDLRTRVPIHQGGGQILAGSGGEASHTLSINEMPMHVHQVQGTATTGDTVVPTAHTLADSAVKLYAPWPTETSALTSMKPDAIDNAGGSVAHENRQPFLVLTFVIALQGLYPSRN